MIADRTNPPGSPPAHRHPAYIAGYEWAKHPTRSGCPYDLGTDDFAMWRLAVEDYGIYMRATGQAEIEDVDDDDTDHAYPVATHRD